MICSSSFKLTLGGPMSFTLGLEDMEAETTLVEKVIVGPATLTKRWHLFLSNIDLTLVTYLETVTFFGPPPAHLTFSDVFHNLCSSLSQLLVPYNFVAGRLEPSKESSRLGIDCNDAGMVVVAASTTNEMGLMGKLRIPKPAYKELIKFLQDEGAELRDQPLMSFQLTRFQCGGIALASRTNHCLFDGVASQEFQANLAAFTRGEGLIVTPNPDRTVFSARAPPKITHSHLEYSKLIHLDSIFSAPGMCSHAVNQSRPDTTCVVYMSPERIARLKTEALKDSPLMNCTTFSVLAAKIWKARTIAIGLPDDRTSTMLFPVDVRKRVGPPMPHGFAGNAVVPGFARASTHELKTSRPSFLMGKIQEGLERLDDEYVKSGIDWLEVHKGVPCTVDSFSVVAWWKLGLEKSHFGWGPVRCITPVEMKPGLVFLLQGEKDEGGINVCLELPSDHMKEFYKQMMED